MQIILDSFEVTRVLEDHVRNVVLIAESSVLQITPLDDGSYHIVEVKEGGEAIELKVPQVRAAATTTNADGDNTPKRTRRTKAQIEAEAEAAAAAALAEAEVETEAGNEVVTPTNSVETAQVSEDAQSEDVGTDPEPVVKEDPPVEPVEQELVEVVPPKVEAEADKVPAPKTSLFANLRKPRNE